jgi:hypothetical protein
LNTEVIRFWRHSEESTMTDINRELTQRGYNAFAKGDITTVLEV